MGSSLPVSVILTTYNEEAAIDLFFDSLATWTALPKEVVVCDGGSTDATIERIGERSIAGVDIHVYLESGANIARGRNAAVKKSSCEILAITDAGCLVHDSWLERITEPLRNSADIDVVAGGYRIEGRNVFEKCAAASSIPLEQLDPDTFLPSSRSFSVRKSVFMQAGDYPEELTFAGEDTALCRTLKYLGSRFATRWDAIVTWFPRSNFQAFMRQHYCYGLGDGESRAPSSRYARIAIKWILLAAITAAGCINPNLYVVPVILIAAYYLYLRPKYCWSAIPFLYSIGGYSLVLAKELSLFAGFVIGILGFGTNRR